MARNEYSGDTADAHEWCIGFDSTDINTPDSYVRIRNLASGMGTLIQTPGGVVKDVGDELSVTPTSPVSDNVIVGTGMGWTHSDGGEWRLYGRDQARTYTSISPPPSGVSRIDRIGYVTTRSGREGTITHITGTNNAGVAPDVPAAMTTDASHFRTIALLSWRANANEITQSDITYERDSERFAQPRVRDGESTGGVITTVTSLPPVAAEGTAVMFVNSFSTPDFSNVNQFYGMQTNGDYLYVCAEYTVFGAGINMVRRYRTDTGQEDATFAFSIEGNTNLDDSSTSVTDTDTPSGLAVNDTRIYISRYTTSGDDVYVYNHSGDRVSGEDINFSSSDDGIVAAWADNNHLYTVYSFPGQAWRLQRSDLDGSSPQDQSPSAGGILAHDGLTIDNGKYYRAVLTGNSRQVDVGTVGDTSNTPTKLLDIPSTFSARAMAVIDDFLILGAQDGTVITSSIAGNNDGDIFIFRSGSWLKKHPAST